MTSFPYTISVLLAALLAVACGGAPEPGGHDPTPAPEFECGPSGYTIEDVAPGDVFIACGPERIQSTVTTGGTIAGYWDSPCLTITVRSLELGATAIVIDLRGAGGRSICADTFTRDGAQ